MACRSCRTLGNTRAAGASSKIMQDHAPPFPFFVPTDRRPLSSEEHSIIRRMVGEASPELLPQLEELAVVGRCGCGQCPTVLFQRHERGDQEKDVRRAVGMDKTGGLVAAVLFQKGGLLSQLEFYSVDGHTPWQAPLAESLELQP